MIRELHRSVRDKQVDKVKQLLFSNAAADINKPYLSAKNPIHVAARAGSKEIVQLLLDAKAEVTVKDSLRHTPLELALSSLYEASFKQEPDIEERKKIVKSLYDAQKKSPDQSCQSDIVVAKFVKGGWMDFLTQCRQFINTLSRNKRHSQ
jgi:hypothetical protein